MQDNRAITAGSDDVLVAFSAELAAAAYSVALRHGAVGEWLDLEMDLWRTLTETVERWGNRSPVSATVGGPRRGEIGVANAWAPAPLP